MVVNIFPRLTNKRNADLLLVFIGYLLFFCFFIILQENFLTHSFPLGDWNFNKFIASKYYVAFFLYLILISSLIFLSDNFRSLILITSSIIFATLLYGNFCFVFYLISLFFYWLVYLNIRPFLKIIIFFLIYELFVYLALNIFIFRFNNLFWYSYIFANLFSLRFVLFFYYSCTSNFKKEKIIDYLLYLFCPVFFVIFPHIVILPRYDYFKSSIVPQTNLLDSFKSGLKYFSLGLFQLVIFVLVSQFILQKGFYKIGKAGFMLFPLKFICILLVICGYGNLLLGLIRGIGYNIKSPFNNPFVSVNLIDFFNRFIIYFKEYIVTIFFVPISLFAKPLNKYLCVFISVLVSIVLGVTLHSFLSLGLDFCSIAGNYIKDISTASSGYAAEVYYGVGIWGLHRTIGHYIIYAFIFGLIFGLQLIYNYKVAEAGSSRAFYFKTSNNLVVKILQVLIMLTILFYMYGYPNR